MSSSTDWRRFKIENIKALKKIIKEKPNAKVEEILSIANVSEPYLKKKTTLEYLKDMETIKYIYIDKKTGKVSLCS